MSYVRKVAVLGIAKVNEVAPEAVKGSDLIDILYNMLKDNDTAVAANAISTLGECAKKAFLFLFLSPKKFRKRSWPTFLFLLS